MWRFLGYAITLIIIYFSLNPAYPLKQAITQIPFGDPIIHLCAFGFLTFCFFLSCERKKFQLILGFGLIILAVTLEIMQTFIGRVDFELADSFANTIGVVIGYLMSKFRKKGNLAQSK